MGRTHNDLSTLGAHLVGGSDIILLSTLGADLITGGGLLMI